MSATEQALQQIRVLNAPAAEPPTLLDAAKVVVALSGWSQVGPERQAYVTSAMAIAVLQAAIVQAENPTFRLAPEPVRPGVL